MCVLGWIKPGQISFHVLPASRLHFHLFDLIRYLFNRPQSAGPGHRAFVPPHTHTQKVVGCDYSFNLLRPDGSWGCFPQASLRGINASALKRDQIILIHTQIIQLNGLKSQDRLWSLLV